MSTTLSYGQPVDAPARRRMRSNADCTEQRITRSLLATALSLGLSMWR
jgi:hypothetical protein